jgi:hypothetical protein
MGHFFFWQRAKDWIALMSIVNTRRRNGAAPPRCLSREVWLWMIVQRWGRSLETSVIKL